MDAERNRAESEGNMKQVIIPKGSFFAITRGAYSDYALMGFYRANVDIDSSKLMGKWCENHPKQKEDYGFEEYGFWTWVYSQGLCEEVEYYEWHLSDYGKASEMYIEKTQEIWE